MENFELIERDANDRDRYKLFYVNRVRYCQFDFSGKIKCYFCWVPRGG